VNTQKLRLKNIKFVDTIIYVKVRVCFPKRIIRLILTEQLHVVVLVQYRRVTDKRTDGHMRTDDSIIPRSPR